MKINLIPHELQPTRVSPIPYFPLLGIAAICLIWLFIQFVAVASARKQIAECAAQFRKVSKELNDVKDIPDKLDEAATERERLRLRAALITLLTKSGFGYTRILEALARTTPAEIHVTDASFDPAKGTAMLLGYGSEEKADIEVAIFLRSLTGSKTISEFFGGVRLDFCNSAKQGEALVKKFSFSLPFRADRLLNLGEGSADSPDPKTKSERQKWDGKRS